MKCPSCGKENSAQANFCVRCARKLKTVCNCWVKKRPFNCGMDKCPGYKLATLKLEDHKKRWVPMVGWARADKPPYNIPAPKPIVDKTATKEQKREGRRFI